MFVPPITLNTEVREDEFTQYLKDKFDVSASTHAQTIIPSLDKDELTKFHWNVGCIIGNSGSGKTTLLKSLGDIQYPSFDHERPIISQLTNDPTLAVESLQAVGLSSIPIYLHRANELSNGERARLDVAWHLLHDNGVILLDEFTSVVNRNCAKALAFALQRYVRSHNLQVVVASCHFDIVDGDWLKPDWVFNLNLQENGHCDLQHITYDSNAVVVQQVPKSKTISAIKDVA